MAKSLVWKDLTLKQIYDYQSLRTPQESQRFLRNALKLEPSETSSILLDMFYYALCFAREHDMSPEQTSAFFSILKQTHQEVIASPLINLEKDHAFFKNLLLQHSVHRPPFSESVFTFKEMKLVNEYFRHYLMYKYAFTKKLRLDMIVENFMPACSQSDAADESAAADATETSGGAESAAVLADKDLAGDAAGGMATAVGGLARTSSLQADQLNQTMAGVGLSGGSAAAPGPSAASLVAGVDASTAVDPAGAADGSASSDGAVTTSGTTGISGAQGQVQADDMAQAERSLDGAISGEPGKGPSSKQDTALAELKGFISTILSSKLEEIKSTLQNKLAAQEEAINSKLRKIEGGAEDDKKKDGKAKPKK